MVRLRTRPACFARAFLRCRNLLGRHPQGRRTGRDKGVQFDRAPDQQINRRAGVLRYVEGRRRSFQEPGRVANRFYRDIFNDRERKNGRCMAVHNGATSGRAPIDFALYERPRTCAEPRERVSPSRSSSMTSSAVTSPGAIDRGIRKRHADCEVAVVFYALFSRLEACSTSIAACRDALYPADDIRRSPGLCDETRAWRQLGRVD